jgi:cytochrome c oxidase subunit II
MNFMNLSVRTLVTIAVIAVLLIAGGFIFALATPLIFPDQASAEAQQVDDLFRILLVIGGAIFLLVQGMLAFSVWRFRAKAGDTSDGIVLHGNNVLEIVWTAIPAVIVFILTILSYNVFWSIQAPKENEMQVGAVGARFNWAFSHNAPMDVFPETLDLSGLPQPLQDDIEEDNALTVTTPQLHTYVGRPVELVMEPRDVIHSFWVPAFRIKQDLIPGRETTVRFTPTAAGTYPIRCAELCGANHGLMITDVVVHEDETAYNAWLVPEMDKILHPPPDPVIRGEQVLIDQPYPCFSCHVLSIDDPQTPWIGAIGPALNGVADRAAGPRSTATGLSAADYLYQSIQDPHAYLVPGFGALMPPNLVQSDCEIQAIVAYLCTVSDTGQPQCTIDEDAYAQQCVGAAGAPSGAESTPEAGAPLESTAEATAELTGDSTAEATSEPVVTSTPAPTSEGTAEATAEG